MCGYTGGRSVFAIGEGGGVQRGLSEEITPLMLSRSYAFLFAFQEDHDVHGWCLRSLIDTVSQSTIRCFVAHAAIIYGLIRDGARISCSLVSRDEREPTYSGVHIFTAEVPHNTYMLAWAFGVGSPATACPHVRNTYPGSYFV